MHRSYALWTVVAVVALVALTCAGTLTLPQLEPDDYRYLSLIQSLRAGDSVGFPEAFVVENRWDHIWFSHTDAVVRFFRPTVLLSFWLDWTIAGDDFRSGLLITNILLHGACCLLVAAYAFRVLGGGLPAVAAALLFTSFAAHAETIWYVSGRTDTLAALGFLAALVIHVRAAPGSALRYAALPAFLFGFVSKELTAALPVLLLLHDRYVLPSDEAPTFRDLLRRDWKLYAGYAAIAIGFLVLRQAILGGATGSDLEYPYFIAPWSARFPGHLLVQLRTYLGNLFVAETTAPFATIDRFMQYTTWMGHVLSVVVPFSLATFLLRNATFWVFSVFAVLTWLPTCFVYVSERYLYLPSIAVAAIAGLVLKTLQKRETAVQVLAICALIFWGGLQAFALHAKNRGIMRYAREAVAVGELLERMPERVPRGAKVLFVNFPGEMLHTQFLEYQMRVLLKDPTLQVRVVSLMPDGQTLEQMPRIERDGAKRLRIESRVDMMAAAPIFPWTDFATGRTVDRPRVGFSVEVVDGSGASFRKLRLTLAEPIDQHVILRYVPGPLPTNWRKWPKGELVRQGGRIERVRR